MTSVPYSYVILRISPSLVAQEQLNVGVVLHWGSETEFVFTRDIARVQNAFPKMDMRTILRTLAVVHECVRHDNPADVLAYLKRLLPEHSQGIIFSEQYNGIAQQGDYKVFLDYLVEGHSL